MSLVTQQRAFSVALLDSFAAASLQELDYLNEAANQEKFRRELGNNFFLLESEKLTDFDKTGPLDRNQTTK